MRIRISPEARAAANRAALLAVVSLPMYDADDNTLTAIVDRGMLVESGAEVAA
jgi:hypothetical protein